MKREREREGGSRVFRSFRTFPDLYRKAQQRPHLSALRGPLNRNTLRENCQRIVRSLFHLHVHNSKSTTIFDIQSHSEIEQSLIIAGILIANQGLLLLLAFPSFSHVGVIFRVSLLEPKSTSLDAFLRNIYPRTPFFILS